MIVRMVRTKIQLYVTIVIVTKIPNTNVIMENVYRSYGIVILMMIVAIVRMSRPTYVEIEIAVQDGESVHHDITTVVFQVGCSVMAKMIVVIIRMKRIQNYAPYVM